MLTDTLLLMQLYWKLDRREISSGSPWRILLMILAAFGILAMGAFSGFVGFGLSFLTRPEVPVDLPPGLIPGLMLTFVLVGVLLTGLNQSVKALFLSGDLDRLMVAPIQTRSVMVAKLLSRLPATLLLLLVIAGPAFVGYGIGLGAGPVYYVVGLLLLLCAPLFGLSLGAVLAMLLVRWLPVNRLSELLAAAYALIGIGVALLFQIPNLYLNNGEFEVNMESASVGQANSVLETIDRLPIPTLWAGRGLMELDAGSLSGAGLIGLITYLLITAGLFGLILLTAERLYLSGWLKTQSAGGKRRGLEDSGGAFGGRSLSAAIGIKDWLLRFRDPRQMVSLVGGGFIAVVIFGFYIFRGSGGQTSVMDVATTGIEATGIWRVFASLLSPGVIMAAYAFLVGFVFLSNMATYALPLEGRAFPLLKAAPVRPRDVWLAKLRSVFIPYIVLFVIGLVVTWLVTRYSLSWLPYAVVAGLLVALGLLAASVSTGFRYANLEWTDPRRMVSQGGGLVSFALSILYGAPALVIILLGFGISQAYPRWTILAAGGAMALLGLMTWGMYIWMARWADSAWEKLPV